MPSKGALRRVEDDAVSPVIGTILLVAITVILAAVLYIAVANVLSPVDSTPRAMGMTIAKTTDGTNWSLTVVYAPAGLSPSEVRLAIVSLSGELVLQEAFADLEFAVDGAAFLDSGGVGIGAGDRVLLDAGRYPAYFDVTISDATTVLFHGFLV